MDLIDSLRNLSISHRKSLRDDDFFVDRLHHRYTVAVLVLFCAIVTTNQYAGEPINCWFVYFLLYIIYINFFNYYGKIGFQLNLLAHLNYIQIDCVGYKILIL